MSEIKILRKVDFPDSIQESFRILEKHCNENSRSGQSSDTIGKIAEEFIFLEIDRRGIRRKLSPMKELQILERMTTYFSEQRNDMQQIFLWLFIPGKTIGENRLSVLSKLVSVAVADLNANVLNLTGMWMQMSDCVADTSLHIAKVIVNDYLMLMPILPESLKKLPSVSPLFCSSLMCALTAFYKPEKGLPPPRIMELVLGWLRDSPLLPFSPLKMIFSHKSPGPQTPIPGLIQWCIMAPLFKPENLSFSHLHLTILETLMRVLQRDPPLQQYKHIIVPNASLIKIVSELKPFAFNENIQLSLDRLAQAIQMLFANGCLKTHAELFQQISLLPQNRLMQIVICKCKM